MANHRPPISKLRKNVLRAAMARFMYLKKCRVYDQTKIVANALRVSNACAALAEREKGKK